MYINPYSNIRHKEEEDDVITEQLHGWVYESHCWVVVKSFNHHNKVCKWCGRKSTIDMVINEPGGHTLCAKNPEIKSLVKHRERLARKDGWHARHVGLNKKPNPDVCEGFTVARHLIK